MMTSSQLAYLTYKNNIYLAFICPPLLHFEVKGKQKDKKS